VVYLPPKLVHELVSGSGHPLRLEFEENASRVDLEYRGQHEIIFLGVWARSHPTDDDLAMHVANWVKKTTQRIDDLIDRGIER
jgi:hypothetical protein